MLLRIIHVAHGSIFVNPMGPGGGNEDVKGIVNTALEIMHVLIRLFHLVFFFLFYYVQAWTCLPSLTRFDGPSRWLSAERSLLNTN